MDNDKYQDWFRADNVPEGVREAMQEARTETGRTRVILVGVGDHAISRALSAELLRMSDLAKIALVEETHFLYGEARALNAMEHAKKVSTFAAMYGNVRYEDAAVVAPAGPKKNDPWYRREARGGKRNRRW
jgi:hypothetical protein